MATAAEPGWKPCPATAAPAAPGAPAWSVRMYPGNVCGPQVEQEHGAWSGTLRAPLDLTVQVAGKQHCCQGSCGHLIQRGQLHGSEAFGGRRFCACCVTAEKPDSEFIPQGRAA